jgi:KDO2-lipid IV(A) lauroyltransferase
MPSDRSSTRWTHYRFSSKPIFVGIVEGTRRMPLPVLRGIAWCIGWGFLPFVARLRRALFANMGLVRPGAPPRELRRLARRLYFSYLSGVADFWHCAAHYKPGLILPAERGMDDLRAGGRILLSSHVGNWELGGLYLKSQGIPFVVIAQPEEDPYVERKRQEARARFGIETLLIDDRENILFKVRERLEGGANIVLLADRAFRRDHVPVNLFGEPAAFLRTPFLLSRWLGRPIVPMFFLAEADGRYRGHRLDPIEPRDDAAAMALDYAVRLEEVLRRAPWQWYNFFDYREHCRSVLE